MNALKEEIARITNIEQKRGTLAEALIDADVFIGVSAADVVDEDMIRSMNHNPIILPWLTLHLKLCLIKQNSWSTSSWYRTF